jgi:FKBP-type peptidyl-prolyl cis-trans isomerase 2
MQDKDFIRLKYSGKIKESGQPLDSRDGAPIIIGAGYVLPGIDEALKEMKVGEKKTVEIPPEKGFGPRNVKLIKLVSVTEFRKHGQKPVPGMTINADNKMGRVMSVTSGRVKVDFNHPLAGKVLVYELEIKEKIEKPEDKITLIAEFYGRIEKDKIKVVIKDKEVEIDIPPMVNSLFKKKIADDIIKFLDMNKVKFLEVYEKK